MSVCLEPLGLRGSALQHASARLKDDKDVVLAAVAYYGNALRYVSARFKDDKDVVLAAVAQVDYALEHASGRLQNDKAFKGELVNLTLRKGPKPRRNKTPSRRRMFIKP